MRAVFLSLFGLLLILTGCTCTRSIDTKASKAEQRKPSTLFNPRAKKAPIAPDLSRNARCEETSMVAQSQMLSPTVGMIMREGPENGMEQMDALAQGIGIEEICCANLVVVRVFSEVDPDKASWDVKGGVRRAVGYMLERCMPKNGKIEDLGPT